MDRRRVLQSFAAGAALAGLSGGRVFAQTGEGAASAAFRADLERITQDYLFKDAQLLTMLGMDRGPLADARFLLSDGSLQYEQEQQVTMQGYSTALKQMDRNALTVQERSWYDSLDYFLDRAVESTRFGYGSPGFPAPYRISQLTGVYQGVPDFLRTQHRIEASDDAEAYLARLEDFAVQLDHDLTKTEADLARGVVPPDFVIERTLTQLRNLTDGDPAKHSLVESLSSRAAAKGLEGNWAGRAEAILKDKVFPALQKQVSLFEATLPRASHDAGIWARPSGEDYYGYGLRYFTTTDMTADEIHQVGLDQVAEITARIETILRRQGMTEGTVGQRVAALSDIPGQVYPNTDAGKAQLLADLNGQMNQMNRMLPNYFGRLPKSPCEVRRVPVETEAGAPGGYYMPPALDGSRPGAYYINLRDTAEWPKFTLPTLTWHEAAPGHHFQIALQMEQEEMPLLMRLVSFSANTEGWGLYAEQLADEMGIYADDPLGEIGYLQSLMFRSARLVVDTGLHAKRWSREQAIRYMVDALGDQESAVATEVERYCVWPGQACSYKVGHNVWAKVREDAKARLGSGFDIKGFHDTALAMGGVPMAVLEREMRQWNPGA